ncbi:MAG: CHAP domain-containing protein [Caulobacterales bacterium]
MTSRAMFIAATAITASFTLGGAAEALTPMSIDASVIEPQAEPSQFSTAAPSAFAPNSDDGFEPSPELSRRFPRLQCVPFARMVSGVQIFGNANTWWQQASGRYAREREPQEGAVMVMRGYAGAARGHVAFVKKIVSDRIALIDHANWMNGGEVTRDVPVRDVSPRGDWTQVQVWNVAGAHWGGRTYNVQGFILRGDEPGMTVAADGTLSVRAVVAEEMAQISAERMIDAPVAHASLDTSAVPVG